MTCLNCGADTTNGLGLCELCQTAAASCLEFLPVYYRNLARWRPGRTGSRPVPGSRVLYDGTTRGPGTGDRISDTLDDTLTMLRFWAQALVSERPNLARLLDRLNTARAAERITDAETAAWLCRGFDRWLTSISTTPWSAAFVRELNRHETRLRQYTEALVPGWYAGACPRCTTPTYVVRGLTWVTCDGCGTTTHAGDHLDLVLREAAGWVARPKQLAATLVALLDTEQSVTRLEDRIRQWSAREKLTAVRRVDDDGDEVGPKRYRLGDVLTLLNHEGQTRTRQTRTTTSQVQAS